MAVVSTVHPAEFAKVNYDTSEISALIAEVAATVPGLPEDLAIEVRVDEELPTTRVAVASLDPIVFTMESGALENTKQPREFGRDRATETIGRLLFELLDRMNAEFGAPETPGPEDLGERVAWDAYCYGRTSRAGHRTFKPKHVYNFRNRHGFTDAADAVFEQLWSADDLAWSDVLELLAVT